MRTARDRIRHAILFELIALILVTPLGRLVFGVPMGDFGIVAVVSATIAMLWNYVFNLVFDRAMLQLFSHVRKKLTTRILHALLFEVGLLLLLVPFIAWYLDVSLWRALALDISLAVFYLIYAFNFNWAYDAVFPVPEPQSEQKQSQKQYSEQVGSLHCPVSNADRSDDL